MSKLSLATKSTLSVQAIFLMAIAWGVLALLFFLLFSVSGSGAERPEWYVIVTYVLEEVAFLGAGLLCFRNWRSSQIVSGRTVWLAIGLGMFSYFIGNLFLGYWEILLHKSPSVSPGDFFFILTYLFLGWGMLQAVTTKQLNLTPIQWGCLVGIAVAGVTVAVIFAPTNEATAFQLMPPAVAQTAPATAPPAAPAAPAAPAPATSASPSPSLAPESPAVSPVAIDPMTSDAPDIPDWALAMEAQLEPLSGIFSWLYIIGDVVLLVMATTLLLAFWGGRFSLSWRFIAAAAFSYYIADIWFNYATNYIPNYETGGLLEVFWIFSGCLFAIGAALEYDLSTRRRSSRRRV